MQSIDRQDRRSLRQFGLALGFMVALVFGLLGPSLFGREIRIWPFAVGAGVAAVALAWPAALYPVHRVLRPPLAALAALNNWLLLGLVFFLVHQHVLFVVGAQHVSPDFVIAQCDGVFCIVQDRF